ncbi:toxic anion resistance protein [Solibaculum mannosilyticum]|uniref:Tellurium resistance protein n=1 Tax=Solibaculum mannosilyticum TaxID=2780922 RepID=A0A7I8D024_9FIRM|nr:toxic anion resistance protein [Solibaculum mannosilyticum]BCI60107.1 tellurium resistance protein [Solibaculum mannosilyticum]
MDQEFEMPTLTVEPEKQPSAPAVPASLAEEKKPPVEEIKLTEQEQKMVEDFLPKIQLKDSNLVLQYGSGAQKKIADFSENILNSVRTKDLGEIGEMISQVVTGLESFDAEEDKGFLGFFRRTSKKIDAMKTKYNKAEANLNKICEALEGHQVQLIKDIALLDKMYELNTVYFKELCLYIIAGKRKLEQVRSTELAQLTEKARLSGLPEDAQAANDLAALCNRFEKKVHDLELTRMISIQMAPQIRLVQNNNIQLSDKIQSILVNTIPLWKSQMVLALGLEHSRQALTAQRQVTDMTNELLHKNAEMLKMSTVETAKESERGIVDMETLRHTNESLISTLDEVMRIQAEGRQKRQEAEVELARLEGELKQKLLPGRD